MGNNPAPHDQTTSTTSTTSAPSASWEMARLMEGYLVTQLLYVTAKLGIADVLADGPQHGHAIARQVGADPDLLTRTLRGLAVEGVLDEEADGRFALTDVGACLRDGVPGSLRGAVIARAEVYYQATAGLLQTVLEGGTAFEHAYGERFFAHLSRHAEHAAAFQASMAGRSAQEARDVVAAYDFTPLRLLVDVGGGQGILLAAILRAAPELRAVLLDRPAVVDQARQRLEAADVAGRCEFVAGDFFDSVPGGADAYLLSRVIHDWPDADARRILGTCRAAMPAGGRLLLVEAILPERARDRPAAIRMDLHMLVLLGARERTEAEFRRLLADSGFQLVEVHPTRSPAGLSVIEATPAT